jgi:hypothetical protein
MERKLECIEESYPMHPRSYGCRVRRRGQEAPHQGVGMARDCELPCAGHGSIRIDPGSKALSLAT